MLTTAWASSGARSPRNSVFLRRLCALLVRDELRHRPPVTLPGRSAVIRESSPPRSPIERALPGPQRAARPNKLYCGDAEPEDVFGLYTRAQLVQMNQRFVQRLERAFRRGAERRDAACATYRAGSV
jgi:hypothetical protein